MYYDTHHAPNKQSTTSGLRISVKTGDQEPGYYTQPLCRFFSQGRHCHFGKKCRFLHIRDDAQAPQKTFRTHAQSDFASPIAEADGGDVEHRPPPTTYSRAAPLAGRRPCRYFMSGHCSMEDRCRFLHPPQLPPVDDQPRNVNYSRPAPRMAALTRPGILQEVKLSELTDDIVKQLRGTEIKQLIKRFPKDQLIIQDQGDGKVTYYRATVGATDPDWPFDLKEIDIMVRFPDNYPKEIFTLDVPLDQDLPQVMARHVQRASQEWLQAKHATNELLGKVELLFRPFLRWLDRSLERLFTEGARQLKKDIDLEKAGLQFISYQELQATVGEKSGGDHSADPASDNADAGEEDGKQEKIEGEKVEGGKGPGCDEGQQQQQEEEEEEASHLVQNIKISDPRRGTELKLLGLRLGDNTATVVAQKITVCLQCNR
uniref:Nucleoporin NUP42 n=1 Tax=Mola mola TaxID=94237 RepID=A0A3Q3WJ88_MOLML